MIDMRNLNIDVVSHLFYEAIYCIIDILDQHQCVFCS